MDYLEKYSNYTVNGGDLVISLTRSIISTGLKVAQVPSEWNNSLVNQSVAGIKPLKGTNLKYIYYYLYSGVVYKYVEEKSRSLMQPNLSITDLKKLTVSCPSIEIQNNIVAKIEKEQRLINATKHLIEINNRKIKNRIAKVWRDFN